MMLKVENTFIPCVKLHYHPDPVFINYQLHTELDPDLELKIYVSLKVVNYNSLFKIVVIILLFTVFSDCLLSSFFPSRKKMTT